MRMQEWAERNNYTTAPLDVDQLHVYHASWCNEGIAVCVEQGQVMLVWPHQMYLTGITAGVIMEIIAGFWNVWTM